MPSATKRGDPQLSRPLLSAVTHYRCKAQVLHGLAYRCNVGSWVIEAALNEHVAATLKSLQQQKCAATNVCGNKNVQQQTYAATKMCSNKRMRQQKCAATNNKNVTVTNTEQKCRYTNKQQHFTATNKQKMYSNKQQHRSATNKKNVQQQTATLYSNKQQKCTATNDNIVHQQTTKMYSNKRMRQRKCTATSNKNVTVTNTEQKCIAANACGNKNVQQQTKATVCISNSRFESSLTTSSQVS